MANPKHNPRKRVSPRADAPAHVTSPHIATATAPAMPGMPGMPGNPGGNPWAGMTQAEMIASVVTRTMGTPYAADPATGNLIVLADRRSGGNAPSAPQPGYTAPQGYDALAGKWGAGSWPLYGAGQGAGNAVTSDGRTLPIPTLPQISPIDPDLHDYGASGTSFFGGLIQNDEYDPEFAWRDAILKYEQMRRNDGQIRAVEKMLTLPLLAAKWSVKPASDSLVDQEIASFVESCLFHDMVYRSQMGTEERQTWPDVLRHALLMLFYGFMPFELVYRIEGDWVKWARWQPLLPRTVWRWWVGPDNALEGIQQWAYRAYGYQFTNVPRGKLVLFVNDQEGQNYEGRSVLRNAFKHWWILQNIEKIAAIAIERNGIVPPVFTLGQNATPGDVTAALRMGANLRANEQMAVVLPHDWHFEYPRLMENHAAAILPMMEYQDTKIARSILASFLMNGGSSQHGTQAMDQSQVATFLSSLQAVAEQISETAQEPIRRLVDYNFDGVAMYPTLECAKLTASNLSILKDIVPALAEYLPPGDEINDFFADLVGLPRPPRNTVEATNPTTPSPDASDGESDGGGGNDSGADDSGQQTRDDSANRQGSQPANGDDAGAGSGAGAGDAAAESDSGGTGLGEFGPEAVRSQPLPLSLLLQEAMTSALDLDPVERGLRHLARAADGSEDAATAAGADAVLLLHGGHEKGYTQNRASGGKFATGESTLNPPAHHPRETRGEAEHAAHERATAERTAEGMHARAVARRDEVQGGGKGRGSRAAGSKAAKAGEETGGAKRGGGGKTGGKRSVSDEEFHQAVLEAHQAVGERSLGMSSIHHVRAEVMQRTGMSRQEFDQRLVDMKVAGDRGHLPYHLQLEPYTEELSNARQALRTGVRFNPDHRSDEFVEPYHLLSIHTRAANGSVGFPITVHNPAAGIADAGAHGISRARYENLFARGETPAQKAIARIQTRTERQTGKAEKAPKQSAYEKWKAEHEPLKGQDRVIHSFNSPQFAKRFVAEKQGEGERTATNATRAPKAPKTPGTKAAKGQKAGAETKGAKASKGEGKTGGKTVRANSVRPEGVPEFARIDSQLALHFRDMHNVPPHDLWSRFGGSRQSVYDALKVEPRGALEAIAHNFVGHGAMPRMVRSGRYAEATNRHRLATTIADHLNAQFGGESQ